MTLWQPGMRITAARLNDYTPVPLTSTAIPAGGFTLTSFNARRAAGTVEWSAILVRSGDAITAGATGNITDVDCLTVPADCRPGFTYFGLYETAGVASGALRVSPAGVVTLTSLDPTASIAKNATVNLSGTFATG
ncbi:hypothetical protein ABTZ57_16170 [Streptomyces sp. NPDC094048]|uniref:hypothetical protein n=1 Tax=Streptomyces sp. NPDC094048 TaxID=3155207 RepID=UPI00331E91BB